MRDLINAVIARWKNSDTKHRTQIMALEAFRVSLRFQTDASIAEVVKSIIEMVNEMQMLNAMLKLQKRISVNKGARRSSHSKNSRRHGMIEVKDRARAVRTIEALNALSVVLPLYEPESRAVFRAAFKLDLCELMPKFFMDLARLAIRHEDEFTEYLEYVKQLILYIDNPKATLPLPANAYDRFQADCKAEAQKLLKSWRVEQL